MIDDDEVGIWHRLSLLGDLVQISTNHACMHVACRCLRTQPRAPLVFHPVCFSNWRLQLPPFSILPPRHPLVFVELHHFCPPHPK